MTGSMAKGAAWMVMFRLFDRSIGLISTALLARLLLPADYGMVAMAMSVIAIIELATAFSFEVALIQKPEPQRAHYDTAWTLNILLAAGGAAVTAALAVPVAAFYGDPRLTPVMLAICAGWLLSGFENIGIVDFRRRMDFNAEFRFLAGKRIVSFVVVVITALALRSYWALVIGMISARVAGVVLSYAMQPMRPRFSLACARELFSFSGWLLVNNAAAALLTRVPHYFVGRVFGAQALGHFSVGVELAQLAQTELVAPINRAMFPGFSRLAGDRQAFVRTFVDANSTIALIAIPVAASIAVLAEPLVRVLLGPGWGEAARLMPVLALASGVQLMTTNTFAACLAMGLTHFPTVILTVRLVILIVAGYAIVVSGGVGLIGLAYVDLIAAAGGFFAALYVQVVGLKVPLRGYFRGLWRPVLAAAAMAWCMRHALFALGGDGGFGASLLELVVGGTVGIPIYALVVALLWRLAGRPGAAEVLLATKAKSMLAQRRSRVA